VEYKSMLSKVRHSPKWSGRMPDDTGQFFKVKAQHGVPMRWSTIAHTHVCIIPQALQGVLEAFYQACNPSLAKPYLACAQSRDYSATRGKRAEERGLSRRSHRIHATGRRAKMVTIPKK
jgi:hypothetical protein